MKRLVYIISFALILALFLTSCQKKKQRVSEEIEQDIEIINNRINDLDKQMRDLKISVDALKQDINTRMSQIDDAMNRLEASRAEARAALNSISVVMKGEKGLAVPQQEHLPTLVRVILIIIIIILLVILFQKFMARPYASGARKQDIGEMEENEEENRKEKEST